MSKSRKTHFAVKDWIAVSISLVALVLSIVTFYFTNFRIDDNLQARVADTSLDSEKSDDGADNRLMIARVAFVNAGNRPAVLLSVHYLFADKPDSENGAQGAECQSPKDSLPILIPPRDMRILDLRIPIGGLIDNIDSGDPLPSPRWVAPGKSARFVGFLMFSVRRF